MKKVLIIEKIHKSGIELLESRKDFCYEVVENLEKNFLKDFDNARLYLEKGLQIDPKQEQSEKMLPN